ncbi:MAG TPA: class I SAM-dependent rRNA methyltransferase [Isosphaeraceae bacterium]|nr:class I SAM-dependent rRNA methyltransferase [Isosphaeraceae bacterium]
MTTRSPRTEAARPPVAEVPDRPLGPTGALPVVAIRGAGHHPFVYRKMVAGPAGGPRPSDGDLIRVVDRDGLPVGFGLWNSRSQIALRLLSTASEPPGPDFWEGRIDRAIALRRDLLRLDDEADAYRVVHAEGDGLSGLIVDRFGELLSIELFSLGMYQRLGPIVEILARRLGTRHFLARVDERIALAEDFPGRPVASADHPPRVTIREHGLRFRVHFEGGHKTGFFCDQRDNRRDLARFCRDKTVLDVCCYTGGFSIHALAAGGAREATGVDLDEKAVAIAKENANLNQVRLGLVHADAFGYMRQMAANGRSYGVVVLDPPKLIPGRLDVAVGKRKYFDLNTLAMGLVEPGGILLTCSCSGLLPPEEFLILLRAAARRAGREARVLAVTGAAADHPVGLEALEGAYLKAVWLQLGDRAGRRPGPDDLEPAGPLA